jgi:hypothetical protein
VVLNSFDNISMALDLKSAGQMVRHTDKALQMLQALGLCSSTSLYFVTFESFIPAAERERDTASDGSAKY